MNARRRLVVRIRDGHWLAAAGFLLIICLFGCRAEDMAPNGDRTPQPGHTTTVTCPPHCPPPPVNPTLHAVPTLPADSQPPVPDDATGYCTDGSYTTLHSNAGKREQCQSRGAALAGDS